MNKMLATLIIAVALGLSACAPTDDAPTVCDDYAVAWCAYEERACGETHNQCFELEVQLCEWASDPDDELWQRDFDPAYCAEWVSDEGRCFPVAQIPDFCDPW